VLYRGLLRRATGQGRHERIAGGKGRQRGPRRKARGGAGPTLFSYDKRTDQVTVVGPLFDQGSPLSWATGEGWYWSATLPTKLYVNQGPRLSRYDVLSHQLDTVFDVAAQFGPDRYIWQIHSSSDDRVHSATLRSSVTYEMLGCIVYREDTRTFRSFPKIGDFDECQVDKSGRWLLIKENVDGVFGEDNRVIDLQPGLKMLLDQQGAAGHSDNGYGYMVAQDNWNALPGAVRVWTFGVPMPGLPPQGRLVYHTMDWSIDIGHISHANARPDLPAEMQYACGAQGTRFVGPRANEIVCFRLDGSLDELSLARQLIETLRRLPLPMQKDAVMVAVLHRHGGLFLDVDTLAVADVAPLLALLERRETISFHMHLACIAARPGARLLGYWLGQIRKRLAVVRRRDGGLRESTRCASARDGRAWAASRTMGNWVCATRRGGRRRSHSPQGSRSIRTVRRSI
jgi:hypothetical protein